MKTWMIQILWFGSWRTLETGFHSQDDAEWRAAQWNQQNNCTGDPFRAIMESNVSDDGGEP